MKSLGDNTDQARQRYLTNEEKIKELEHLEAHIANGPRPNGEGGQGYYIDLPIVPYLRRINNLNGVCTVQSCIGHVLYYAAYEKEYTHPGGLWLRLSADMAKKFYCHISNLVRSPLIGRATTLYLWHDGYQETREIVSINFQDRDDNFEDTMEKIIGFLEKLNAIHLLDEKQ